MLHRFASRLAPVCALAALLAAPGVHAAEIAPDAESICPILVGAELPEAPVRMLDGTTVPLREALTGEPTVFVVYRAGWCPICVRQLAELRHVTADLRKMGYRLVAMCGDTPERLAEGAGETEFELLSDYDLTASIALGLAFRVSDEYVQKLAGRDYDIQGNSLAGSEQALPVPAVLVLDAEARVRFSYVDPNYRVRLSPEVLVAAARSALEGSWKP